MRSRMMSCWLFRAVFRTSTYFAMCLPSPALLSHLGPSLLFSSPHSPNTYRFNGWGVTLVDSLDTMYIMGLHEDFEDALGFVGNLTFSMPSVCPSYFLSSFSRLPPSFPLHLLPCLSLTSYTLTSTHPFPSPANLLRTLLRNRHPLPWRPPLSTRTLLLPDPPLKS